MVGDLAVDQERHADVLHPLEYAHDVRDIGDAVRAAGGRVRGVEFGGGEDALRMAARDFVRVAVVGEIGDDQRREIESGGHGGVDAVAIGAARSEEHTSELQSLMRISYAVFCLK